MVSVPWIEASHSSGSARHRAPRTVVCQDVVQATTDETHAMESGERSNLPRHREIGRGCSSEHNEEGKEHSAMTSATTTTTYHVETFQEGD